MWVPCQPLSAGVAVAPAMGRVDPLVLALGKGNAVKIGGKEELKPEVLR
jgi:hypothetical protein